MDYTELKRLAEAARDSIGMGLNAQMLAVHAFEDQASPDVVLGLLAEVERLKAISAENDEAIVWATQHVEQIITERDRLRTQNQALLVALELGVTYMPIAEGRFNEVRETMKAAIKLAEGKDV